MEQKYYKLCNKLDGEFVFVLYDSKLNNTYIARDPYGVRPLFIGITKNDDYVFSSELKGLNNLAIEVEQFVPGSYMFMYNDLDNNSLTYKREKYHNIIIYNTFKINEKFILEDLNLCFKKAIIGNNDKDFSFATGRPICDIIIIFAL